MPPELWTPDVDDDEGEAEAATVAGCGGAAGTAGTAGVALGSSSGRVKTNFRTVEEEMALQDAEQARRVQNRQSVRVDRARMLVTLCDSTRCDIMATGKSCVANRVDTKNSDVGHKHAPVVCDKRFFKCA